MSTLHAVRVQPGSTADGRPTLEEIPDSDFDLEVDLVLLAMGFIHPEHTGIIGDLGVELDGRGNVKTDSNKMTSLPGVFSAGDMARGQSLVVWAIAEGRHAAYGIDKFLMGTSTLPQVDLSV